MEWSLPAPSIPGGALVSVSSRNRPHQDAGALAHALLSAPLACEIKGANLSSPSNSAVSRGPLRVCVALGLPPPLSSATPRTYHLRHRAIATRSSRGSYSQVADRWHEALLRKCPGGSMSDADARAAWPVSSRSHHLSRNLWADASPSRLYQRGSERAPPPGDEHVDHT